MSTSFPLVYIVSAFVEIGSFYQHGLLSQAIEIDKLSPEFGFLYRKRPSIITVLHPLKSRYQDMEVKKGEFQIIGRVAEKEKRY